MDFIEPEKFHCYQHQPEILSNFIITFRERFKTQHEQLVEICVFNVTGINMKIQHEQLFEICVLNVTGINMKIQHEQLVEICVLNVTGINMKIQHEQLVECDCRRGAASLGDDSKVGSTLFISVRGG